MTTKVRRAGYPSSYRRRKQVKPAKAWAGCQ
jgi:hypothetical protein